MSRSYYDVGDKNVQYVCVRCGTEQTENDLEERGGHIKCISCGYKVLKKTKPPVVRRIPAI